MIILIYFTVTLIIGTLLFFAFKDHEASTCETNLELFMFWFLFVLFCPIFLFKILTKKKK